MMTETFLKRNGKNVKKGGFQVSGFLLLFFGLKKVSEKKNSFSLSFIFSCGCLVVDVVLIAVVVNVLHFFSFRAACRRHRQRASS